MKYSFRKSFRSRRRKETHSDDQIYPRIEANGCSNSNSNLVKPIKSKTFLQRQRRQSSSDEIKAKVFEPRCDTHSDDDDDPFSSLTKTRARPLDRLTNQLRKSFRNTLTRQRPRLESTNSNKRLIATKPNENPILHPFLSTGLTSPLPISIQKNHINQSISLPNEINSEHQKPNFNRSLRTRFSFLLKKQQENADQKPTLSQRFDSLRRSFHIGNRNSSNRGKRYLLSNE